MTIFSYVFHVAHVNTSSSQSQRGASHLPGVSEWSRVLINPWLILPPLNMDFLGTGTLTPGLLLHQNQLEDDGIVLEEEPEIRVLLSAVYASRVQAVCIPVWCLDLSLLLSYCPVRLSRHECLWTHWQEHEWAWLWISEMRRLLPRKVSFSRCMSAGWPLLVYGIFYR